MEIFLFIGVSSDFMGFSGIGKLVIILGFMDNR
jgi:hypothetical protein